MKILSQNYIYYLILCLCFYNCNTTTEEEPCPEVKDSPPVAYFIDYSPVRLFDSMERLFEATYEGEEHFMQVENFAKIQDFLLEAAAIGPSSKHTFETQLPLYAGLSFRKVEIMVHYEIDSIQFYRKAGTGDEASLLSGTEQLTANATEIWKTSCVRENRLQMLKELQQLENLYTGRLRTRIGMTVGIKQAEESFVESTLIYASGELEDVHNN